MRIGIVASAHGYGHATRDAVLARTLRARGHRVTLLSAAPPAVLGDDLDVVPLVADVGLVQHDSLSEDLVATRAQLDAFSLDAMQFSGLDRLVVDISPFALEAARRAGVPTVAMGNFDWAWIYRHYPDLRRWAATFERWQAPHRAVSLAPGPGLHGFCEVVPGGLLARSAPPVRVASRAVLTCFGGFGMNALDALLPELPGVTWVLAPPMPRLARADARYVDDVPFPALVAGADALFTKPGYGVLAEATVAGTPIVYLDRGAFPEAPFLEAQMRSRGDERVAAEPGAIAAGLARVWSRARPPAREGDDREAVADAVLSG
ncbi:MAG: hypothetical protein FJ102_12350 [Deltaproteobacteria bacterium]|nr:hypothetical protein [Deltaproteobacteria bacterium]